MILGRSVLSLLVGGVLTGCGAGTTDPTPERSQSGDAARELRVSGDGWRTDFSRHSVPLGEFIAGGPPRDGIPPIDEPKPVPVRDADEWLDGREPVLVVEVAGAVRAYPVQILVWHEIVNDETLLDLAPLDPVFERAFGNAELRRQWFSLMLLLAFVGGLTGRYVDFTRAQRAALSMLAEAYGIALDADMSRTSSSSTPAAGSATSIALTVREWFAPRKIRGVALARARYTRR